MKELFVKISDLIRKECDSFQLFLTGSEIEGDSNFIFYMDSEEPLNMKTLTEFTRHISVLIDEGNYGDIPFTFEVSSPGADRPLTDIRQYGKHIGRKFLITTTQDEEFEAQFIQLVNNQNNLLTEWNVAAQIQLAAQVKAKPKAKPKHTRFEEQEKYADNRNQVHAPHPKLVPVPEIAPGDFPLLLINKIIPVKGKKVNHELMALPFNQVKNAIIIISFK